MNIKKCLFNLAIATGAFSLAACTDYDNGYEENMLAYQKNFEDLFGKIDPNATWNATSVGKVTVSVPEQMQVMTYAKGLSTNLQLTCDVLKAGETREITYNVPYGVKEVCVVALNANDWKSTTVMVDDNGMADFTKISSAKARKKADGDLTPLPRKKIDYVGGFYSLGDRDSYVPVYNEYNSTAAEFLNPGFSYQEGDRYYSLAASGSALNHSGKEISYGWGHFYAAPSGWQSKYNSWTEVQYNHVGVTEPVAHGTTTIDPNIKAAIQTVFNISDNSKMLLPYSKDFSLVTQEAGEITLTYVLGTTSGSGSIGYFYTKKGATTAEKKAAPKYILMVGEKLLAEGDQYKLTFYGEDGNGTPTFTFPAGYEINFFIATSQGSKGSMPFRIAGEQSIPTSQNGYNSETSRYELNYETFNDIYGLNANLQFYSDNELNEPARAAFGAAWDPGAKSTSAAWSTMGVNVLSLEDWPNTDGSCDWNDVCFMINGQFNDFETVDEKESFIIALEDLGSTDDFDFNDVVLRVRQTTTTIKKGGMPDETTVNPATVTLMAAGGTMPIKIVYDQNDNGWDPEDEVLFEEVHDAFGVNVSDMVNTGRMTRTYREHTWTTAPDALNMATDAHKFLFCVQNNKADNGQAYYTINVPNPAEEAGATPQAFLIPAANTWQWPLERVSIGDRYTQFATWVQNNSDANAQYWYNYQWGKTYGSVTPPVDPVDPGEGGSGSGSGGGEPVVDSENVYTINAGTLATTGVMDKSNFVSDKRIDITIELTNGETTTVYLLANTDYYANILNNENNNYSANTISASTTYTITNLEILSKLKSFGAKYDTNNMNNNNNVGNIKSITITNYK